MNRLSRLLLAASLLLLSAPNTTTIFAQEAQYEDPSVDHNLRSGQLPNGLTYFIRHNSEPKERADFYIAQRVGSILEEPNQRGLAHFLEHMCFNGTTHFPGNRLREYLESIGVRFGENLNAYTGVDETVYNISNVPVITVPAAVDSCLLMLHDWSCDLTLDSAEIEKERGVINEEWRTTSDGTTRLNERAMKQMYPGTRYAECSPIGSMDVVMNFKHQALRDYYKKWYRPDLQAVIVVGDVDVDAIEAKIKALFADVPAPQNAAERVYFPVPDNDEPIIIVDSDKEKRDTEFNIYYKHNAYPADYKNTFDYKAYVYYRTAINIMLNARLAELVNQANPPFINAAAADLEFYVSKTKDAFTGHVVCKEDNVEGGISAIIREILKVRKYGFSESEFQRAKAVIASEYEKMYNEREKIDNESYVENYVEMFVSDEPYYGPENEYRISKMLEEAITLDGINAMLPELISDKNIVITLFGPEKEGFSLPTKERVAEVMAAVYAEEIVPYADTVSDRPLLEALPEGGKIVAEQALPEFGATQLTLSNGVKVIVKETDFMSDEIQMEAVSFGGYSLYGDEDNSNVSTMYTVGLGGLGDFSVNDLRKVLAGKKASVSYRITDLTEGVSGNCTAKDFETMLQLTYLTFTAPRRDDAAFASYCERIKSALVNNDLDPFVAYLDSIHEAVYPGNLRMRNLRAENIDNIDYGRQLEIYKERFGDAGDFTFILVGNVNLYSNRELIARYLGGLPAAGRNESYGNAVPNIRKGSYSNVYERQVVDPKASNFLLYDGKCDYNLRNRLLMAVTTQVLDIIYTQKVREDEGGTYGVGVDGEVKKLPTEEATLQIDFTTAPAKRDKMVAIVKSELNNLATVGPEAETLNKVKEFMLKKHAEDLRDNSYWVDAISRYTLSGLNSVNGFEEIMDGITSGDVKSFVNSLIGQGNVIEVDMIGLKKEDK